MSRPEKERTVHTRPDILFFKPKGIRLKELDVVELNFDELEAMRLCYRDGHYQHDAAKFMNISRQTVGRILTAAISKITAALIEGKAIAITGGNVEFKPAKVCPGCLNELQEMTDICEDCEEFGGIKLRKTIHKGE